MTFLLLLAALARAASPFPTSVSLSTADGRTVAAAWGAPAKATQGVVLVHAAGRTKEEWQLLADKLYRSGLQVIAVDLRGHGASAAAASPLQPADYPAMIEDVRAAAALLRARGCTRVALVGAELGANLAINEAADDPSVASVVMLSPGVDYKGVIASDAVRRFGDRPVLLVAAADDVYATRSLGVLAQAAARETVQTYPQGGKGTAMLNRVPELESVVMGFVRASWTAPVAAPAPTTAPAIKVDAGSLETSGPVELPPTP